MSKAHKLRNLKLRKVDFVDQGANQFAHIQFAKRNEEPNSSPESSPEERAFFERFGAFIAKMFHGASPVSKGDAMTYEQVVETRDTRNAIYRISDSMCESIHAIINDKDLDDAKKAEMVAQTADEVAEAIKEDIAAAFSGSVQKDIGEGSPEPPAEPIEDHGDTAPGNEPTQQEGEIDMNFDTSKMTPEEKVTFDELAKRYAVAEPVPAAPTIPTEHAQPEADDVYKGLHPAVKAELESLRKFREESEMRELNEVAKKYTLLGKKPEELAPVLKSLRDAGGSAYNDMISILDSNLEAVEKSGVFSEIGKRGGAVASDPWSKIEVAAQEIMKSNADMRWSDAIDKACLQHPDLVEEYEKSRK